MKLRTFMCVICVLCVRERERERERERGRENFQISGYVNVCMSAYYARMLTCSHIRTHACMLARANARTRK
jgi:hypothetical protein